MDEWVYIMKETLNEWEYIKKETWMNENILK